MSADTRLRELAVELRARQAAFGPMGSGDRRAMYDAAQAIEQLLAERDAAHAATQREIERYRCAVRLSREPVPDAIGPGDSACGACGGDEDDDGEACRG